MRYLLYCACEAICSILQEKVCHLFWIFVVLVLNFFSLQHAMFHVVKTKTNRVVLSDNHHRVEQPLRKEAGDGSPEWVARNLCATEC